MQGRRFERILLFGVDLCWIWFSPFGLHLPLLGGKCVNFAGCAPVFEVLCSSPSDLGYLKHFRSPWLLPILIFRTKEPLQSFYSVFLSCVQIYAIFSYTTYLITSLLWLGRGNFLSVAATFKIELMNVLFVSPRFQVWALLSLVFLLLLSVYCSILPLLYLFVNYSLIINSELLFCLLRAEQTGTGWEHDEAGNATFQGDQEHPQVQHVFLGRWISKIAFLYLWFS